MFSCEPVKDTKGNCWDWSSLILCIASSASVKLEAGDGKSQTSDRTRLGFLINIGRLCFLGVVGGVKIVDD